jgi:RHS repeat-associated protein
MKRGNAVAIGRVFRGLSLNDHLGNVRASISDGRQFSSTIFDAVITDATDYFPFGAPNRSVSSSAGYRYGFNGKELDKSNEFGTANVYDYGFRIYNPSIGRFLSVDPLTRSYPELTPYQFASNTPIWAVDLDGLESMTTQEMELIRNKHKPIFGNTVNVIPATQIYQAGSRPMPQRSFAYGYSKEVTVPYKPAGLGAGPTLHIAPKVEKTKVEDHYSANYIAWANIEMENYRNRSNAAAIRFGMAIPLGAAMLESKLLAAELSFSNFLSDGVSQYFTFQAGKRDLENRGKTFLGNYNFFSGMTNALLKNPFTVDFLSNKFSLTIDEGFQSNSFVEALTGSAVGGILGHSQTKLIDDRIRRMSNPDFRLKMGSFGLSTIFNIWSDVSVEYVKDAQKPNSTKTAEQ